VPVFTHAVLGSAGISYRCVCVSPSVTSRSSTKMAKCRIMQTVPLDSPGTLVFWCRKYRQNYTGGAKCRWSRLFVCCTFAMLQL